VGKEVTVATDGFNEGERENAVVGTALFADGCGEGCNESWIECALGFDVAYKKKI
jgi:hypothetical protein